MKWFDSTVSRLEKERIYTRKELLDLLQEDYPYVSGNSYQWAIADMVKAERIVKVGYNQYRLPDSDVKDVYIPQYSETARKVIDILRNHLPEIKAVLFESSLLNAFLDEKITDNVIFLETEKEQTLPVFRLLQEQGIPNLIYRPTKKDFLFYRVRDSIVATDMTSEAPVRKNAPHEICIEKLLADIFCDRLVRLTYSFEDYKSIADAVQARYLVDKPRLMRYAGRRGGKPKLIEMCPGLAVNEGQAEWYKHYSAEEILSAAGGIIYSLPESQREFFDYIHYGKLTQGELARLYGITPQAITNRIKKLYNTVMRRLAAEYGYTEEEIKRILKYRNEVHFLRMIV